MMRLALGLLFAASCACAAGRPAFRLGVLTDTHIGEDVASCARVRAAMELFRREMCGVIVHNGDIAEKFSHDGYRALRGVIDGVFAKDGAKPKEIWTYAWHDAFSWHDRPRTEVYDSAAEAWLDLRRDLRIAHGHTDTFVFGGYAFLLMPQFVGVKGFISWPEYEKRVAEACRANPGKPVFLIDHVPPQGTIHDSGHWGDPRRLAILSKFPQIVQFAGHSHGSVRSDMQIWQDAFTVVSAGCLQKWEATLAGNDAPPHPEAYGVLTVDVRPDGLTVRRWDVRDGTEAGAPWEIPLPFDPATAPWNRARRARTLPPPQFADDASVSVDPADKFNSEFRVSFPDVPDAETFRVEVLARGATGAWSLLTRHDALGAWWMSPTNRSARIATSVDSVFFDPLTAYRFRVLPVSANGVAGCPLSADFMTPASLPVRELVWSSANLQTNVVLNPWRSFRLPLPQGLFAAPKGTKFRFVVEVETGVGSPGNVPVIRLAPGEGLSGVGTRAVQLADATSGCVRYVLSFWKGEKAQTPDTYDIVIDYGAGTSVRFGAAWLYAPPRRSRDFTVTDFAARADGTKCTEAFARAVAACVAAGGGRVVVPTGTFHTGKIHLKSNVELHLERGAVLDFSDDPKDYEPGVPSTFEGCECLSRSPLVYCYGCTNVAVTGPGMIRPRLAFWSTWAGSRSTVPACKAASDKLVEWSDTNVPVSARDMLALPESRMRPPTLQFNRCRNVRVENLVIRGSPFWTVHLYRSEDVVVRGCDIDSHAGDDHREGPKFLPMGFYLNNTDGVDVEMSRNVLVERCRFCQCDDVIAVKAGRGPDGYLRGVPSENIEVRDCDIRMGHSVLSIGSEISGGARHVRAKGIRVSGEITGGILNVKTNRQRGGFVEDIAVEDVTCHRVRWPLHVDAHYSVSAKSAHTRDVAPTRIRGLRLENVRLDWARTAALIEGDPYGPAEDVTLKDIVIRRHEPLYRSPEFIGEAIVTSNVKDFKSDGVRVLETGRMTYKTGEW